MKRAKTRRDPILAGWLKLEKAVKALALEIRQSIVAHQGCQAAKAELEREVAVLEAAA